MSKIKFNWGHGLALALIGWVGLMVYMGFKCFSVDAEFVREDYYQAELEHEDKMVATALGASFSTPRITYLEGVLIIEGEAANLDAQLSGHAELYVPTNSKRDRQWVWSELEGGIVDPGHYQFTFDAPHGLAYLTFHWLTPKGPAEQRAPVHFPSAP